MPMPFLGRTFQNLRLPPGSKTTAML
jgi:hypothetical protein